MSESIQSYFQNQSLIRLLNLFFGGYIVWLFVYVVQRYFLSILKDKCKRRRITKSALVIFILTTIEQTNSGIKFASITFLLIDTTELNINIKKLVNV